MAGTGGALKALAKNLSNQLNLSRTEMKRVVARVISECHGRDYMGDYHGHMFYVKPDRIDLTQQITQSKEAFDEMLSQKRIRSRKEAQNPSGSRSRSLTCRLAVQAQPQRSLTGVIIDKLHRQTRTRPTPNMCGEQSAPNSRIISTKCKRRIKPKRLPAPSMQYRKNKSQAQTAQTKLGPRSLAKVRSESKPKPLAKKKSFAKAETRAPVVKQPKIHRIRQPAGDAMRAKTSVFCMTPKSRNNQRSRTMMSPVKAGPTTKKTGIMKKQKQGSSTLPKMMSNKSGGNAPQQSLPKKDKKHSKRLSAGAIWARPKSKPKPVDMKPLRNPYQSQNGAGTSYQPNRARNAKSKNKLLPAGGNRPTKSLNSIKRINRNKRSITRLAKHLEREEAIDDLERFEARNMRTYRPKECVHIERARHSSRPYSISARLKQLALPAMHRRYLPLPAVVSTNATICKPSKKRCRRSVQVDTSLGSIGALKNTSRTGLSPAKRNLALAFLHNEGTRSPRNKCNVLWR
ncbi:GH12837 [Drosophila grimshawi]|uniref:GH12837 n=2 Tax=Drosophila grimshawi TaxID=7222 RepID=B4JLD4_DROGR|nr:GH12837 [Drosophila grimshawi]